MRERLLVRVFSKGVRHRHADGRCWPVDKYLACGNGVGWGAAGGGGGGGVDVLCARGEEGKEELLRSESPQQGMAAWRRDGGDGGQRHCLALGDSTAPSLSASDGLLLGGLHQRGSRETAREVSPEGRRMTQCFTRPIWRLPGVGRAGLSPTSEAWSTLKSRADQKSELGVDSSRYLRNNDATLHFAGGYGMPTNCAKLHFAGGYGMPVVRRLSTGAATSASGNASSSASVAVEMVKYSRSCKKEAKFDEAARVLEQGYAFLSKEIEESSGKAPELAVLVAGRMLLDIASLAMEAGRMEDAQEALDRVAQVAAKDLDMRVSALEAKVAFFLQHHKDGEARACAEAALDIALGREGSSSSGTNEKAEAVLSSSSSSSALRSSSAKLERTFRAFSLVGHVALAERRIEDAAGAFAKARDAWQEIRSCQNVSASPSLPAIADGLKGLATFSHCSGDFQLARELYEHALQCTKYGTDQQQSQSEGQNLNELVDVAIASQSEEVTMDALLGLGQLCSHMREFDEGERRLTEALRFAELVGGEKHPRVGIVLSATAELYAKRSQLNGTGETLVAEGLFRRALQLLGASVFNLKDQVWSEQKYSDVIALTRARYAVVLSAFKNREQEALRESRWAEKEWKCAAPLRLAVNMQPIAVSGTQLAEENQMEEDTRPQLDYPVLDARLGRVFF
ncbi:hypothetical protein CBR_g8766 [Chara braunii]|uniref:MalT-like TPR region domain-containing protein n=1 Tax=Chara braunii TaxID=69332 RepID=A0A388KMQ7_CHABU|nr:hypothetical protein CBR_g8766 [Chara braunii]|eukprot:GBG71346.1 hypothetical protein CBR_g8766 [Chara braunii]